MQIPYTVHHVRALTGDELFVVTFANAINMQLETRLQKF